MRLIIAGSDTQKAYTTLLNAGHRVLTMVRDFSSLKMQIEMEQPDGVLIRGLLGQDADEVTASLPTLAVPVVILLDANEVTPDLKQVATVLPLDTPWSDAANAVAETSPPTAPATQPQENDTRISEVAPQHEAAAASRTAHVDIANTPTRLLLYPVVGGVGSTTLALSLTAATAEIGVRSLVISVDQLALLARLGVAETGRPQRLQSHWFAMTTGREWTIAEDFSLAVWEIGPGYLGSDDFLAQAPLLLLTRPTGEGRLSVVRAVHTLRRRGVSLQGIGVARQGSMTLAEFERRCQGDDPDFPPVYVLPEDPQVAALEDHAGHTLQAPLYGVAVRDLAQTLWPEFPWSVEEEDAAREASASGNKPHRRRQKRGWPIQIELTD
mgnify:CR=1 FL=1